MKQKYKLAKLAGWGVKTIETFDELNLGYQQTPSTKRLINSMIKFADMYNPLVPGTFHVDTFNVIEGKNEYRKGLRARIYLHKKDLIKTADGKGGKRLVLTSRGRRIFYEGYPLAKLSKQKWNGDWSLVTYDLPNRLKTKRDHLRRRLKNLGFGCPQESLYVSPLPLSGALREFIVGENLEDFVWITKAQRVLGLENREISQKAWDLQKLNDLYEKLLAVLPKVKKINDSDLTRQWREHFLAVDNSDPYLPRELLPENWRAGDCKKAFSRLGLPGVLKIIFS